MIIRGKALTAIKQEQRRKKLKRRAVVIALIFVDVLIFVGVVALAMRLPFMRIDSIKVVGVRGERQMEVAKEAKKISKERDWYLFPRYTMFSSANKFAATVTLAIPWVEKTEASFESPNSINLSILERSPSFIVCDRASSTKCFYADKNTLVFAPAPQFSAPVYPELSRLSTTSPALIMSVFFDNPTATKISDLQQELRLQNLELSKFEETVEGSYRAYVRGGWYIYFTRDEPIMLVSKSLMAVMGSENFVASYKKNPHSLEYVDVRLADKAFYKFNKGDSNVQTTPAH